jgi:hypothetical protein
MLGGNFKMETKSESFEKGTERNVHKMLASFTIRTAWERCHTKGKRESLKKLTRQTFEQENRLTSSPVERHAVI